MMIAYFSLAAAVIAFYLIIVNMSVITGWIGWVFTVMGPFIAGFIIAYLLSIPCVGMQKLIDHVKIGFIRKRKKAISIVLVYLLFIFIIYMSIYLVLPHIIFAIADLVASLPMYYQQIVDFVENIILDEQFPLELEELWDINNIMGFAQEFISYDAILSYLGTILGGANILFRGFLAIISSIYFLFETENLSRYLKRMMNVFISQRVGGAIVFYGHRVNQYFKKYIFCLIIDCVAMGVVGTIVLYIIGSPYFIFLGILLGLMNFIPYFGSIIATIIAIIVVWFTQDFTMAVISAIVLLIIQQLDANALQPRLYGSSLKLSPLLVIVSVTVGGAIGGAMGSALGGTIMGMIVAIPCMKVIMNILEDIMDYKEKIAGISTDYHEVLVKEDEG